MIVTLLILILAVLILGGDTVIEIIGALLKLGMWLLVFSFVLFCVVLLVGGAV